MFDFNIFISRKRNFTFQNKILKVNKDFQTSYVNQKNEIK
jgi:hypothetical protein